MKGEDSERGREYWLTCNTESGGGRDPANIKYIITFILISLLAPVCLLARLRVAMASSAARARTTNLFTAHFPHPRESEFSSCPYRNNGRLFLVRRLPAALRRAPARSRILLRMHRNTLLMMIPPRETVPLRGAAKTGERRSKVALRRVLSVHIARVNMQ